MVTWVSVLTSLSLPEHVTQNALNARLGHGVEVEQRTRVAFLYPSLTATSLTRRIRERCVAEQIRRRQGVNAMHHVPQNAASLMV